MKCGKFKYRTTNGSAAAVGIASVEANTPPLTSLDDLETNKQRHKQNKQMNQ